MNALLRAFAEEPGSVAARIADCDAIATAELLAALYARGRAAHPRVVVSEEAFGRHLGRCACGGGPESTASLAEIAAEDVYLACACAARVRGAAAAFEARFGRVIRRAVHASSTRRTSARRRSNAPGNTCWSKAATGRRASRSTWGGDRSRSGCRLRRCGSRSRSAGPRAPSAACAKKRSPRRSGVDPEALFSKGELRDAFEIAVTEALAALKPRERLVMKLFLVSGMTLDAIGKSLGITRQAVSKTLARARETIVERVDASVQRTLKMTKEDLTSVLRYVASQLDVSISRVLGKS